MDLLDKSKLDEEKNSKTTAFQKGSAVNEFGIAEQI